MAYHRKQQMVFKSTKPLTKDHVASFYQFYCVGPLIFFSFFFCGFINYPLQFAINFYPTLITVGKVILVVKIFLSKSIFTGFCPLISLKSGDYLYF